MRAPTESFERVRSRFLVAAPGRITSRMTCEGGLGRIDDGTAIRRFCGEPPLSGLDADCGAAALEAALLALRTPLSYANRESLRVTIVDGVRGPERHLCTWSMTVRVAGLHLGWSGAGDGAAELAPIGEEIEWLGSALQRARALEAGTIAAVLAPSAAAVLLHEAVGHLIEAAPERPSLIGHRIAAECISASDDPTIARAPGTYDYDDENVRAMGPTLVVHEGMVVAELHSTASAAHAGTLPTGNARTASVWQEPLARVSNLVCSSGEHDADALADRCGDGIYIHRLANGINNGSRVQADVVLAERIARGRRTGEMLTGGRIDETVSVALRVAEMGRRPEFNGNAMCGKSGQLLFNVGTCAPPVRFASLRIAA